MTMAGKKMCDAAIPNFATQTNDSYSLWVKRNAETIESAKKPFGEKKFLENIDKLSSDASGKFSKDELASFCKEVSDWIKSPLGR